MSQNVSSAAVVIGALRVNPCKPSVLFVGHRQTMQTQLAQRIQNAASDPGLHFLLT